MRNADHANLLELGERLAGQSYISRPGVYAVIFDSYQRVAVIKTGRGYFLPGGGSGPSETLEETLKREAREECGLELSIYRKIGENIEYLFAESEQRHYQIHSTFFEARIEKHVGDETEEDHLLLWLEPREAMIRMSRQSQVWAVCQAIETSLKTFR